VQDRGSDNITLGRWYDWTCTKSRRLV